MIRILIPGEPATMTAQQKGFNLKAHMRAAALGRKNRGWFEKNDVKHERARIGNYTRLAMLKSAPLEGPVECTIKIVYPLTKAQAKKHAAHLSDLSFELPHPKRPDCSNLIKTIEDAVTDAGGWQDDGQICDLHVYKRYGTEPRIEIILRAYDDARSRDVFRVLAPSLPGNSG